MARLFGTDGVRGIANDALTPEIAFRLGAAAGHFFSAGSRSTILLGRDTRVSGDMLEAALVAGITSAGSDVVLCGVVPTPAVAHLTLANGAAAGVVISASHNPPEYNGIKFFGPDGFKLPDDLELSIERFVLDGDSLVRPLGAGVGRVRHMQDAEKRYVAHAIESIDVDLEGMTIAVDCGHGAASFTTVSAFKELGAKVIQLNCDFDGSRINVDCGSTNVRALQQVVATHKVDLAFAHDGDADRVVALDENGNVVDGDQILAICASHMQSRGVLPENTVVATVMSNLGFVVAMKRLGIRVIQTDVGDRHVLQGMRSSGAMLGGEQSGHIIFLEHNSTGDGLVAALQLAAVVKESGVPLSELSTVMQRFPQVLLNVHVSDKDSLNSNSAVLEAIATVEGVLGEEGRVLVRASGTEPLIRIMVEATEEDVARKGADSLKKIVQRELG